MSVVHFTVIFFVRPVHSNFGEATVFTSSLEQIAVLFTFCALATKSAEVGRLRISFTEKEVILSKSLETQSLRCFKMASPVLSVHTDQKPVWNASR